MQTAVTREPYLNREGERLVLVEASISERGNSRDFVCIVVTKGRENSGRISPENLSLMIVFFIRSVSLANMRSAS